MKNNEAIISMTDTPVGKHGRLKVSGFNIVDANGEKYQLRGFSTHGIAWYPGIITEEAFRTLRDEWKINTIRLAMYVEEAGYDNCYINRKEDNKALVRKGVDICLKLGLYVIIDWHILIPGDPRTRKDDAVEFFKEMAHEYSGYPNILYEICNEPNGEGINWKDVIRPYCETVVAAIRQIDKKAIIIAGTGTWSQDIHDAAAAPLEDANTVYAVHFYADTHKQWLRDRVRECCEKGVAIIVSEFGNCNASGGGINNKTEAKLWFNMLDDMKLGYFNWALGDKDETCCVFKPGTNLGGGHWNDDELTESGKFMKDWFTGTPC